MIAIERPVIIFASALLFAAFVGCSDADDMGTPLSAARDAGESVRDAGVINETPHDGGLPVDAGAELDLRDRLLEIDGLDVEEIEAPVAGTRAFALKLRQPEDHQNSDGPTFKQRLILIHRDETKPMVLATTGYGLFGVPEYFAEYLAEPTVALDANQLTVEHRFFGESIARTPTWRHLTIEQSANDSHRIVQLLSQVYVGPWVGTGVSKGGMTAIFHHRFFPDDMAAIVPYVAPVSFGLNDTRYLDFLDQIGPEDGACRDRVKDIAVELVQRRAEVAEYFVATDPVAGILRPEVLEVVVTVPAFSFHWGFWQSWGSPRACEVLPPRGVSVDQIAAWFPFRAEYAIGFGGFDPDLSPYGYQVANELGAQTIDNGHLWAAAAAVDYSLLPQDLGEPPPWGASPGFDPSPMREVDAFLRTGAQHVLGVYGAWDPWSGGMITVDESRDSLVVVVPEIGHAAQLALLPADQQDAALNILSGWVGQRSLVARDWTTTRRRMFEHRGDHRRLVELTSAYEQSTSSVSSVSRSSP